MDRGADLLGVAGGDGTQALVAGVAAEHDVPFLVISAGTRNHFALDLGLDREDPTTCLAALTEDAVELHVDLGKIGGRTFVNNASFGAYAAVVQSPAYREDKTRTTLDMLPDLLSGHDGRAARGARRRGDRGPARRRCWSATTPTGWATSPAWAAGPGSTPAGSAWSRSRVGSARQAVGCCARTTRHGLRRHRAPEVVVAADAAQIPVGIDGEAVMLPTPVRCTIRPRRPAGAGPAPTSRRAAAAGRAGAGCGCAGSRRTTGCPGHHDDGADGGVAAPVARC